VIGKSSHSSANEIGFIAWDRGVATGKFDAPTLFDGYFHSVGQRDRRHERFDFMVTIGSFAKDAEREVDFGWRVNCHAVTNYLPMPSTAKEKIIIAVDAPNAAAARELVKPLASQGCLFKIGLQLFTAEGPSIVSKLQSTGARIFLDLKFHDIPNTAREAVHSAVRLGVDMTTIHLCGGPQMVSESVAAAKESKTLVLGVSVLTSMDDEALRAVGVPRIAEEQVLQLADMGLQCGLRGIVASPREIRPLREKFGSSLVIVTPGVRPAGSDAGDQKRVMTPGDAVRAGADYLVIGRPITGAPSPLESLRAIAAEMQAAL
jgi:orotidine-5'-phosphate decarboxylase